MILKGKLCLNHINDNYMVVGSGRSTNLSEMLNVMLLDDVKVRIKDMYDGRDLLSIKGKLEKRKSQPKYYLYYVGTKDIDSILWNLVDRKLEIEIVNVTNK